jgi:predicted AlkP superfamily phosphohydrolase/phosphomutase
MKDLSVPVERVAIIGLDCAEPTLVFDRWAADLPNLTGLCRRGCFGNLTSTMPPVTVPAWSCMASSKDPGTLGIYGFGNRKDHSYEGLSIAMSNAVKEPRLWDLLTRTGQPSIIIGVPGTFPIMKPIKGQMVTCFLTPNPEDAFGSDNPIKQFTHPPSLKHTIKRLVGEYMVDVKDFQTENKQGVLDQIYEMTDRRFKVVEHLAANEPWRLLFMVEMGVDRIHHGFWQFFDEKHHRYEKGNPFESAIRDYYVHVDKLIGQLIATCDPAKTAFFVTSDHGAKRLEGGVCINDWLIQEGYLVLKESVSAMTKFKAGLVDWSKTRAWGEGGYYGRLYINVAGREPQGIVRESEYEALRDEITRRLEALPDNQGRPMCTRCYKPEDIYRRANGIPPDLILIFGDLHWRAAGSIGNAGLYTFSNETGPDDANHAQEGMYILACPGEAGPRGRIDRATIYDVAPTTLKLLGMPIPADMIGRALV